MLILSFLSPSSLFPPLSSAQVPDNDEQFVPDYQAESCKYSMAYHLALNIYFLAGGGREGSVLSLAFPTIV